MYQRERVDRLGCGSNTAEEPPDAGFFVGDQQGPAMAIGEHTELAVDRTRAPVHGFRDGARPHRPTGAAKIDGCDAAGDETPSLLRSVILLHACMPSEIRHDS